MKKLKFGTIFILVISIIGALMNFMLLLKIKTQMAAPLVPKGIMDSRLIPQYFYIAFYLLISGYSIIALIKKNYSKLITILMLSFILLSFIFESNIKLFILEQLK